MFLSKQFRNFVQSKAVSSIFRDCTFETTRANSIQISFSIVEILPKKFVAHQKLSLLRLHMNAKDFSAKEVAANRLLRHNCFLLENCYSVLQSLHLCIPQLLLQQEMLFIMVLAGVVLIYSRSIV